jgi:putative sigma-54 modulation protein
VRLQVKGRNVPVTDALFEHAERKLGKLTRILPPWDDATAVELELSVERNRDTGRRQVAEVTVWTKGPVLRVRESAGDMYAAIDQAAHKLERQAARYRDRRRRHREPRESAAGAPPLAAVDDEEAPTTAEEAPRIVKSKRFEMKPMSPEDAALQMDLLHHDFFVFRSSESGSLNVVYRRRDGNYGLIAPED